MQANLPLRRDRLTTVSTLIYGVHFSAMIEELIIKLVGKCNLGCGYCYYMNDLAKPYQVSLKIELLESLFQKYAQYAVENNLSCVKLIWHGGEPTLAGKPFMTRALELQRVYFGPDVQVSNSIQTNGTLIDEEWAQIFRKHSVSVGISLDGSKESHDKARPYHSGKGSYSDTIRAIKILRENEIEVGTITVIDPTLNGSDVFNHHYSLGIKRMEFNLPDASHADKFKVWDEHTVDDFSRFMKQVYDEWMRIDDPSVEIPSLLSLTSLMLGFGHSHCHSANQCNSVITIEPNGSVGLCESFRNIKVGDSPSEMEPGRLDVENEDLYATGTSILLNSFAEIESAVHSRFTKYTFNKRGEICNLCSVRDICNSGCAAHRYDDFNEFQNPSIYCEYYKDLIQHIGTVIRGSILGLDNDGKNRLDVLPCLGLESRYH